MSRWLELLRRRRDLESGFTLVEIMVALTLLAVAAAGSIPLFIVGAKASATSRLNTQAKNLAQWRFESMRDLPFHVDRQNGPFVDLLDVYYTNLGTTPVTRTRANEIEVGHWVASGASSPHPAGPFYQVSVSSLPGYPSFAQTIDTQFLNVNGGAIAASTFPGYDSQTEGRDQPPALLVGVTVTTTWSDHGNSHSYTSYTRIADGRGLASTLTSQGSAQFMQVASAGPAGNALTVDVASAKASGSQSTGSVASADVRALEARDAAGPTYEGATATATSPGTSAPGTGPEGPLTSGGSGTCGWVEAGPTQYDKVTADVVTSAGLPEVPSNVDTSTPPTNQTSAQILSGSNTCAGIFGFNNQSSSYSSALMLDPTQPLVSILNAGSNSVTVSGSAWVNATPLTNTPHTVSSGANTAASKSVVLFPGATFTGGAGVVKIKLNQASISCLSSVSGGIATQSAAGSWSVNVSYWSATGSSGSPGYVDLPTYTWTSTTGSGSADPLASIDPTSIVVYQNGTTVLHLSDYIASWSTERSIVENSNSGVHQLDGILSVATQPVRDGDPLSAVGLQVGNLSCVADDSR